MKITISVPDGVFLSADELARRQGVSRSQLYATAVAEHVAKYDDEQITARLNEVLADEPRGLHPAVRKAQARTIGPSDW